MKIIILGAPGSGKGTQARLLAKKLKLKHIVASDLIKKEIKPLLDYYKKNLIKINGDNHQESIKNQILKALK